MLTRLTHAGIAFALTVVVYQAYVLLAVPFIEPPGTHVIRQVADAIPIDSPDYVPPHKYRELLSAYFPAGHWTLTAPPKSFDNGQAMIVLDDYQPKEDGEVRVNKCAVLFFPHERVPGEAPPRDAVILEAPHGAVIQLDQGFRAGFGGIGRLQWARLLGDITVRSDMQEAGPQDDLLLKTRDLYMNQDLIRTDADVDMRLGEHWGKGRVLEIRLVAIERGKLSAGPDIGGIDTLEIVQDVEAHLAVQSAGLFDENNPQVKLPQGELPPVHITSQGRFRFDFTANLASFVDHVRLEQNYSNGARNRLNCDALSLYLAGDDETVSPVVDDPAKATSVAGDAHGECFARRHDRGPRDRTLARRAFCRDAQCGSQVRPDADRTRAPAGHIQRVGRDHALVPRQRDSRPHGAISSPAERLRPARGHDTGGRQWMAQSALGRWKHRTAVRTSLDRRDGFAALRQRTGSGGARATATHDGRGAVVGRRIENGSAGTCCRWQ